MIAVNLSRIDDVEPLVFVAVVPRRRLPSAHNPQLVANVLSADVCARCAGQLDGDAPCSSCGSSPRPCPVCAGAGTCMLCDDNGMVWS